MCRLRVSAQLTLEPTAQLISASPQESERGATFAGADESALFQRLDGIAIGRQRACFFIIFQVPQNWVAAERISFKLVSVLDVRK